MFKRAFLISILYTLCHLSIFGQSTTLNQGKTRESAYFSQIPFEFKYGKIIIKATIENQDFRFILDTGAPTIITEKLYKKLPSKALQKIVVSDQSGLKDSLSTCYIHSIKMGEVTFDSTISLIQNNPIFDCFNVDGMIGSNQLRNSIIHLSLQDTSLIITNKINELHLREGNSTQLYLSTFQSNPSISVELSGNKKGKENVLFDSGYNGFYSLSNKNHTFFRKKKIFKELSSSEGKSTVGLFGAEKNSMTYLLFLKELSIGSNIIKDVTLETTQGDNSCLGTELLNYGTVTVDYLNKKFYFTPFNDQNTFIYRGDVFPFSLGLGDKNKVIIGHIWNKNLLGEMSVGDEVIEINKTPITDYCLLLNGTIRYKNLEKVQLSVRKKNGTIVSQEVNKLK